MFILIRIGKFEIDGTSDDTEEKSKEEKKEIESCMQNEINKNVNDIFFSINE